MVKANLKTVPEKNEAPISYTDSDFDEMDHALLDVQGILDALNFLDDHKTELRGDTQGTLIMIAVERLDKAREIMNMRRKVS